MSDFVFNEKYLSQIPALQALIKLGYQYISPSQAFKLRKENLSNVLLEDILEMQLRKLNRIYYRKKTYAFSDDNIFLAIEKLRRLCSNSTIQTIQEIYDLITLPQSFTQDIAGNMRSFDLIYIDWKNWENNVYHCTSEYTVTRNRTTKTAAPDIILFINGIPLAIIECKPPEEDVNQAISQQLRNQGLDYLPHLFSCGQLLIVVNKKHCKYATTGTPEKSWVIWQEKNDSENKIQSSLDRLLTNAENEMLYTEDFAYTRSFFEDLEQKSTLTQQDRALYSLCRPERLTDLIYRFIIFDGHNKKIARYYQYFVVKSALERVKQHLTNGRREGGVIWQTQGAGKSLTMVMLARSLMLDPAIQNARIVLVTDRDDLDKHLKNTFLACGLEPQKATTGRHLREMIAAKTTGIINALIHKFDTALNDKTVVDDSSDIFVLVDESQCVIFGSFAERMRQMLPNACYIGFTGAPLTKKDKDNYSHFGQLIEPHYSTKQAADDGVVLEGFDPDNLGGMLTHIPHAKTNGNDVPQTSTDNYEEFSYYKITKDLIEESNHNLKVCEETSVYLAEATQDSFKQNWKINFWQDMDAQNRVKNEIDDHLFNKMRGVLGVKFSQKQVDVLIAKLMKIAKSRMDQ